MFKFGFETFGFRFLEKIGDGCSCEVFKALNLETHEFVAAKVINKISLSDEDLKALLTEIELMRSIDHPNIVKIIASFENWYHIFIIMEFLPNGHLLKFLNAANNLNETACRRIFMQIASGIDYLHNTAKIIHRDIKMENIMMDAKWNAKIVDFGLSAKIVDDQTVFTEGCGTPTYFAPELCCGLEYNQSVDVWAAGVILYTLLIGTFPFYDPDMKRLAKLILYSSPRVPGSFSIELQELLSQMLEKRASERITIREVMESKWFKLPLKEPLLPGSSSETSYKYNMVETLYEGLPKLTENGFKKIERTNKDSILFPGIIRSKAKIMAKKPCGPLCLNQCRIKPRSVQPLS